MSSKLLEISYLKIGQNPILKEIKPIKLSKRLHHFLISLSIMLLTA